MSMCVHSHVYVCVYCCKKQQGRKSSRGRKGNRGTGTHVRKEQQGFQEEKEKDSNGDKGCGRGEGRQTKKNKICIKCHLETHYLWTSLNNVQNIDTREVAFLQIVSLHTF